MKRGREVYAPHSESSDEGSSSAHASSSSRGRWGWAPHLKELATRTEQQQAAVDRAVATVDASLKTLTQLRQARAVSLLRALFF